MHRVYIEKGDGANLNN